MTGPTHLAGGLLAGAMLGAHPVVIVSGLAALAPDWLQINLPGGSKLARGVFGHRGFSHWMLTAAAITILTYTVAPDLALYVLAGWGSHILLDVLSDGAPALWPLPRITLAHVKSGSWMDRIVGGALLVLAAAVVMWRLL